MAKITFTDMYNEEGVLEKPKPSSEFLPKWYKEAQSYINGKKEPTETGEANSTVKKCMPLFDMMTAGYMLLTPCDIFVKKSENGTYFNWSHFPGIGFQPIEQVQKHPFFEGEQNITRLINPWIIKTPKGWSIMVTPPSHRESVFQVLPGIVDTDRYVSPTNLFFKLTDPDFEGLIPAGTPFCQIIPFKRESWISSIGGKKERKAERVIAGKLTTIFFDRYKTFWWSKKTYK